MSDTKRRRSANGQHVSRNTRKKTDTWWWDCDLVHAHPATAIKRAGISWCGNELTQDEAYARLDAHNAQYHPHLTKGATDA